jgi:hypothetical protein
LVLLLVLLLLVVLLVVLMLVVKVGALFIFDHLQRMKFERRRGETNRSTPLAEAMTIPRAQSSALR